MQLVPGLGGVETLSFFTYKYTSEVEAEGGGGGVGLGMCKAWAPIPASS